MDSALFERVIAENDGWGFTISNFKRTYGEQKDSTSPAVSAEKGHFLAPSKLGEGGLMHQRKPESRETVDEGSARGGVARTHSTDEGGEP